MSKSEDEPEDVTNKPASESMTLTRKSRGSEISNAFGGAGGRPLSIGVNLELLRVLKYDRFELRNRIAGFSVSSVEKDKAQNLSIMSAAAVHVAPRTTIMNRKSTRDMQMQLRKTKIIRPVQLFQNTYRLDPDKPFDKWTVEGLIKETFQRNLRRFIYEPRAAAIMVKGLSEEIKFRVKLENYDRCRIICFVTITQRLYQSFCEKCKTLLDIDRDQFASFVYEDNPTMYAIGTVFGIYYE